MVNTTIDYEQTKTNSVTPTQQQNHFQDGRSPGG
jgi:hypothetical protein